MSRTASQFMVMLVCSHTLTFEQNHLPKDGEDVWCYRCGKYQPVKHRVGMYRAKCDRCRFTRWYGAARITAQTHADRHARKFATHCVVVTLGAEEISVHKGADREARDGGTQMAIPFAYEKPQPGVTRSEAEDAPPF